MMRYFPGFATICDARYVVVETIGGTCQVVINFCVDALSLSFSISLSDLFSSVHCACISVTLSQSIAAMTRKGDIQMPS